MNIDLKPCPVCGGEMKLRRVDRAIEKSYQTDDAIITSSWRIECSRGCIKTKIFKSFIYEADDGDLIVKNSGPIEAVEFWNKTDLSPKLIYRDEE